MASRPTASPPPGGAPHATAYTLIHEIRPRFRDTDAMGHVNNAVYLSYIEVARQVYWEKLDRETDYGKVPFILAHVSIDFHSEALVSETLEVGIRCEWIRRKSFAFSYRIWEKTTRRLVVEATSVQVCYDYAEKRSIPMPEPLRARLDALEGRTLTRDA